jgi:hypothetical protein
MPSFPTYDSNQNINTTPASPEFRGAGQGIADFKNVLGTVQDITQKLSNANDVMQETKAKTDVEMSLVQQEEAAKNDPNPDNVEAHLKAIQDLNKDATKGISNQEVAGKVALEVNQTTFLSGIKVQDMFKKKQMFANDIYLDKLATTTSYNVANAVSPAAAAQDEANFMDTIQQNTNKGLITPERGFLLVKNYKLGVLQATLDNDPATTLGDSKTYKELNSGKYDLDFKEKESAINMIEKRVKENVQVQKDTQYKTEAQVAIDMAQGKQIDHAIFANGLKNGTMTKKFADSALKVLESPRLVNAKTTNPAFAEEMEGIFKSKTKEEIQDGVVNILSKADKGELSKPDMLVLLRTAYARGNDVRTKQQDEAKAAVKTLGDWADRTKPVDRADVYRDFMNKIHNGESPQSAVQETMKEHTIKTKPEFISFPTTGKIMVDKNGNKAKVFPDGHIEEIK